MRYIKPVLLGWKLFRLMLHLVSGLILSLLFVHDGIHDSPLASRIFVYWNRALTRIFKARITTLGDINPQPTLFVMNHISWFDIPLLASQRPVHFLSKAEVRDWPIIGWLSHRAGTLFIRRGASGAAQQSLQEMTDCLSSGCSVVIFPEGTTSNGHGVKKFHARLLQAAIDAQVKIQPIALVYPYQGSINPYVPYIDDMNFADSVMGLTRSSPLQAELHFLPTLEQHLKDPQNTTRNQLAQMAQQAIAAKLEQITQV